MDETISLLRLAQDAVAAMAPGTYATLEESGGSGENSRSRQHKEIQIDLKSARTFSTRTHRVFYLEGAAYIFAFGNVEATRRHELCLISSRTTVIKVTFESCINNEKTLTTKAPTR
jgi:hypothetical protein